MYDPNSPEVQIGDWAQSNADQYLKDIGKAIIDAHKSGNGGAALIKSRHGARPVMDTIAIGDGEIWFVDSKGKTNSTFTRITWAEQHGIDAALWFDYLRQCQEAGVPGHILLSEKRREISPCVFQDSNVLLVYPLNESIKGFRRVERKDMNAPYGKGGMVYWDRDAFIATEDLTKKDE